MLGYVHSFQSLGTVDGPGVRNVVFMQGCPLRCVCCHNPDTWEFFCGNKMEVQELVDRILHYRAYFGKNGGVTVSGGEPLMQAEFVGELFEALHKNRIHTALDTSGCVWNKQIASLLSVTDLVLLDHKYADPLSYQKYTQGSQESAEFFLAQLEKRRLPTWLRRVIIPGLSDGEDAALQLGQLAARFSCVEKIELLPFRKLCLEKYEKMGLVFPLRDTDEPTNEKMQALQTCLENTWINAKK